MRADNLESDYPTKHETSTPAEFYYFWLRNSSQPDAPADRVVVTGRERRILEAKDVPVFFSGVYKGAKLESDDDGKNEYEGGGESTVPARPLWGIFGSKISEIDRFYDKIRDNIADQLEKYISLGARTQWKGDASTRPTTIAGLPDMYRPTERIPAFRTPPPSMLGGIAENPAERRRLKSMIGDRSEERRETLSDDPTSWIDAEDDGGSTTNWEDDYNYDDFN